MAFKRGNILGIAARQQVLDEPTVRWIKRILKMEQRMRAAKGQRHAARGMYQRIADRVGVSANQIKKIANGQRWRRVRVAIYIDRKKVRTCQ